MNTVMKLGLLGIGVVFGPMACALDASDRGSTEDVHLVEQYATGVLDPLGVGLGFADQIKVGSLQNCGSGLGCQGFAPLRGTMPNKRTRGTNSQFLGERYLQLADVDGDRRADYVQYRRNKLFIESAGTDQKEIGHAFFVDDISRVIVGDFYGAGWDQVCVYAGGVLHCMGIDPSQDDQLRLWFRQRRAIASNQDIIVGDFDKNGRDEILLYDRSTGAFDLWGVSQDHYFVYRTDWDISNLPKAGSSNVQWRAGDSDGDGDDDLVAINSNNQLLSFHSVKHQGLVKFWWDFTTVSNFVNNDESLQLANVDGDEKADFVIHDEETGAVRFHRVSYDNGSPAKLSVDPGQIEIADNSQLIMSYSHVDRNETGSDVRDDAFVYDRDNAYTYKAEARYSSSKFTYWFHFSRFAPNNHYNWTSASSKKVKFVKCKFKGVANQPNNDAFYSKLTERIVGYFGEVSYGGVDMTSSELDQKWYEMSITTADARNLTRGQIADKCEEASGASSSTYDAIVMFTNASNGAGAAGNRAILKPEWHDVWLAVHETAHAITNGVVDDEARDDDGNKYGNPWDPMSAATNGFTYTNSLNVKEGPGMMAHNRNLLAALPAQRVRVINYDSAKQTVWLSALNRPATPHALSIQAKTSTSSYYAIEYREKSGFDQAVPHHAVIIYKVNGAKTYLQTKNENPNGTRSNWSSSERRSGETYTTSEGIKIKVVSIDSTNHQAQIEVSYD